MGTSSGPFWVHSAMEISVQNVAGVLLVIGLLVVVAVSLRRWSKVMYRALPFIYATATSIGWFWNRSDSLWDLLQPVIVMNVVAGFFLGIAWFEFRRKE